MVDLLQCSQKLKAKAEAEANAEEEQWVWTIFPIADWNSALAAFKICISMQMHIKSLVLFNLYSLFYSPLCWPPPHKPWALYIALWVGRYPIKSCLHNWFWRTRIQTLASYVHRYNELEDLCNDLLLCRKWPKDEDEVPGKMSVYYVMNDESNH